MKNILFAVIAMCSLASCIRDGYNDGGTIQVTSITIDPSTVEPMLVGSSVQLTATVMPSKASNRNVLWISGGTDVVTVNDLGLAEAVGAGMTTILAVAADGSGVHASVDIQVVPRWTAVSDITGVPVEATVGIPLPLTYSVVPDNATNQTVVWSVVSAGTTGATIDQGVFNAADPGEAIIRATIVNGAAEDADFTKDFVITIIMGDIPVTGITIAPDTEVSLEEEKTIQLSATVTPDNATNPQVIWSSNAPEVATVDSSTGLVTALGEGTAIITATAADGSGVEQTKTITVTPKGHVPVPGDMEWDDEL